MITLKKLEVMDSLSEETLCYSAHVYWGGRLIGDVRNHGHGGETDFMKAGKASDEDLLRARENAEARPMLDDRGIPMTFAATGAVMHYTLEDWCDDLACKMHHRKSTQRRLVRLMKTKTIFIVQHEREMSSVNLAFSDQVRTALIARYGRIEILNDLPIAQAVDRALGIA